MWGWRGITWVSVRYEVKTVYKIVHNLCSIEG